MDDSGIIAVAGLVVAIAGTVLGVVNHKRVRSECCGKKFVASLDVETTTPPPTQTTAAPPLELRSPSEQAVPESSK